GIEADSVPFDGGGPATTALLGGHVDAIAANPYTLLPQEEDGKIKMLGVFSPERSELIPDVPTMGEQGYDIDMSIWKYLLVPKDVPDERKEFLKEKFEKVTKSSEFEDFLEKNYLDPNDMVGEEITEELQKEAKDNEKIIEELDVELE